MSLFPLGVVLREKFGRDLRSDLIYGAFFAIAILGVLWMLAQSGEAQATSRESAGFSPSDLKALGTASGLWSGVINWLQRGFIVFAARSREVLPG